MSYFIRSRSPGKHELRVTHARLVKPFYGTFGSREEADRVGERAIAVPASTQGLLDTLCDEIGRQALAEITYEWIEAWIRAMKLERRLAPGTMRKRKGALSRVFDSGT